MTYFVKCDNCGTMEESKDGENPFNKNTGEYWYSRKNNEGKRIHACCIDCIKDGELVIPL